MIRGSSFSIICLKTAIKPLGNNQYEVAGDLTIRGITKPVTVPVTYLGTGTLRGKTKAGFEAEFKVDRKDYGIVWNRALDTGGVMLGDDVLVSINLEMNKQPPKTTSTSTQSEARSAAISARSVSSP